MYNSNDGKTFVFKVKDKVSAKKATFKVTIKNKYNQLLDKCTVVMYDGDTDSDDGDDSLDEE